MPEFTIRVEDGGRSYAGDNMHVNYYGEERVHGSPLTQADLAATVDGRFAVPTGDWHLAAGRLDRNSVLILLGESGTGRRTAALRLLSRNRSADHLTELEPTWKQPRIDLFPPTTPGHGYLLDMSELAAAPRHDNFGAQLLGWAKSNAVHLIVTSTAETWSGRWTAGASDAETRLGSPDAWTLVENELQALGAHDNAVVLNDKLFTPIWESSPKAHDAWRLARIIASAKVPLVAKDIIDEYGNWETWIDDHFPVLLDSRALLWSCAFCNGGYRKSVLQMAEDLRRRLGEDRSPLEILSDHSTAKRLKLAKLDVKADHVSLPSNQHGLLRPSYRTCGSSTRASRASSGNGWSPRSMSFRPRTATGLSMRSCS